MKIRYGALLEEKKGIIPFSISTEEEEEEDEDGDGVCGDDLFTQRNNSFNKG